MSHLQWLCVPIVELVLQIYSHCSHFRWHLHDRQKRRNIASIGNYSWLVLVLTKPRKHSLVFPRQSDPIRFNGMFGTQITFWWLYRVKQKYIFWRHTLSSSILRARKSCSCQEFRWFVEDICQLLVCKECLKGIPAGMFESNSWEHFLRGVSDRNSCRNSETSGRFSSLCLKILLNIPMLSLYML